MRVTVSHIDKEISQWLARLEMSHFNSMDSVYRNSGVPGLIKIEHDRQFEMLNLLRQIREQMVADAQ